MQHSVPNAASTLVAMRAELSAFTTLRDVLVAEQSALLASDVERVSQFSHQKAKLVEQLSSFARVRAANLERLGFDRAAHGVQKWIDAHMGSGAHELRVVWQELVDVARETQRMNESNGHLVQTRMQHNQGALDALHGAARRLSLYGPDGRSDYSPSNRDIGRA